MPDEAEGRRKGGRAGRRDAIANAPIIHRPELTRRIPIYDVVNDEGVELIHDFAMRLVEQVGVEFRDPESLEIWRKAGAEVKGDNVRLGREALLALTAEAPSSYIHHARNPQRSVKVGGGHAVIAPSYGPPYVQDLDGVRRLAGLADLDALQKLNHMSGTVHIAGGPIVEPVDVPVPHRHLHMSYSGLKYSDKPVIGNVTSRERAEDTLAMMRLVFGADFVTDNTVTTSLINSNSPLVWDKTMLDALKVYAASNQAVLCSPFSMAGASMPASSVGSMGVITAEALMAIAFAQLIRPGSPMLFGVPSMVVALSTGSPVHGSPDTAMITLLASAMARRYGLPHRSIVNCATSKTPDLQAGFDNMWGLFSAFLSDANWITMAGGLQEGTLTLSYAKAMIDFEQIDAFYHFCQGPKFDDLEEIFETVKEVGPGGHFLGAAHTRKYEMFLAPSQNNVTYEQWAAEGCKDAAAVGAEKARDWLARYEEPALDAELDTALLQFVNKREREIPA